MTELQQAGFDARLEWAAEGAVLLARACPVLVVVDVLRFTTAVEVAVARGARVVPHRWPGAGAVLHALGGRPSPEARAAVAAFLQAADDLPAPWPAAPPVASWPPAASPATSAWRQSTTSARRSPASPAASSLSRADPGRAGPARPARRRAGEARRR